MIPQTYLLRALASAAVLLCYSFIAAQSVTLAFDDAAEAVRAEQSLRAGKASVQLSEAYAKTRDTATARPFIYRFRASGAGHLVYVEHVDAETLQRLFPGARVSASSEEYELHPRSRVPNDERFRDQWNLQLVDAPGAWEYTQGGTNNRGRDVVVGVIEFNGFELGNAELAQAYYTNPDEIPGNGIDDDGNDLVDDITGYNFAEGRPGFDRDSHGVYVSAAVTAATNNGAQAAAINWDATIIPYQIALIEQITVALDDLTALREEYNRTGGVSGAFIVAANLSLGGILPCDSPEAANFVAAAQRAFRAGIITVVAAGNDRNLISTENDFPSSCPIESMIVVGGVDRNDGRFSESNFNPAFVDIAAPATSVASVDYQLFGRAMTETPEGNSFAAPMVTSLVSLLYSVDCPDFDALTVNDPARAAGIIRSLVLAEADRVESLMGFFAEGRRLNVRRPVEALRQFGCLDADVIVQLAEGLATPPGIVPVDAGRMLTYVSSLDADLGIHLYSRPSTLSDEEVFKVINEFGATRASEIDRILNVRSRRPNDAGYVRQDYLERLNLPGAWERIYGADEAPDATDVVTAVFDQNFALDGADLDGRLLVNDDEIADNDIDDDGNGFIDDVAGRNYETDDGSFALGNHGASVLQVVGANGDNGRAAAGIDWAGALLPLQGERITDFIRAAADVRQLRDRYNETAGASGALITGLLVPQGGSLAERPEGETRSLLNSVIGSLHEAGVVTIGAGAQRFDADDFPTALNTAGLLVALDPARNYEELPTAAATTYAYAPSDNVVYDVVAGEDCTASGTSVAAAQLAGATALLYQVTCEDQTQAVTSDPSGYADLVKTVLTQTTLAASDFEVSYPDVAGAAEVLASTCGTDGLCQVLSYGPNPATAGSPVRLSLGSAAASACPVQVIDALGREVARLDVDEVRGVQQIELDAASLPAGAYTLRIGESKGAQTVSLIVTQ